MSNSVPKVGISITNFRNQQAAAQHWHSIKVCLAHLLITKFRLRKNAIGCFYFILQNSSAVFTESAFQWASGSYFHVSTGSTKMLPLGNKTPCKQTLAQPLTSPLYCREGPSGRIQFRRILPPKRQLRLPCGKLGAQNANLVARNAIVYSPPPKFQSFRRQSFRSGRRCGTFVSSGAESTNDSAPLVMNSNVTECRWWHTTSPPSGRRVQTPAMRRICIHDYGNVQTLGAVMSETFGFISYFRSD